MSPEAPSPAILVSNSTAQQQPPRQSSPSRRRSASPPDMSSSSKVQAISATPRKSSGGPRRPSTNSRAHGEGPASLSPTNSRCTSPKLSRDAHSSAPPSPSRSVMNTDTSNGLFERDVEFPSDHLLNAQEAQDVAIPPILQEAAEVLTGDDLQPEQVQTMMRSAASSSALSSLGNKSPGWQSPVQTGSSSADVMNPSTSPSGVNSPLRSQQQSSSSTAQSPVAIGNRRSAAISPSRTSQYGFEGLPRAGSPMSSHLSTSPPDSALFTPSTSPSPPPTSLPSDAFTGGGLDQLKASTSNPQTISGRMGWSTADEEPAATIPASALGFQEPPPPRKPPLRPELMRGSTSEALQLPGGFPSGSAGLNSASMSPTASQQLSHPPSPAALDADAITLASTADGSQAPRNRRLSFMSYADIINSERAEADLTMTANGGNMTQSMSMHQLWHELPSHRQSVVLEPTEESERPPIGTAAA